ncbi:hypothetical protein F5Y15DRAFT_123371 [Xylariaceae sp. FL0016]|nr:hypothetical protein F5Y15DRAFT_123371 [Xylariaceae sp. FL0016]
MSPCYRPDSAPQAQSIVLNKEVQIHPRRNLRSTMEVGFKVGSAFQTGLQVFQDSPKDVALSYTYEQYTPATEGRKTYFIDDDGVLIETGLQYRVVSRSDSTEALVSSSSNPDADEQVASVQRRLEEEDLELMRELGISAEEYYSIIADTDSFGTASSTRSSVREDGISDDEEDFGYDDDYEVLDSEHEEPKEDEDNKNDEEGQSDEMDCAETVLIGIAPNEVTTNTISIHSGLVVHSVVPSLSVAVAIEPSDVDGDIDEEHTETREKSSFFRKVAIRVGAHFSATKGMVGAKRLTARPSKAWRGFGLKA